MIEVWHLEAVDGIGWLAESVPVWLHITIDMENFHYSLVQWVNGWCLRKVSWLQGILWRNRARSRRFRMDRESELQDRLFSGIEIIICEGNKKGMSE